MVIFEEKQSMSLFFSVFSLGVILVLIIGAWRLTYVAGAFQWNTNLIPLSFVFLFTVFSLINYYRLRVVVSRTELTLGFGVIKSSFYIQNMRQVTKLPAGKGFSLFHGFGIRKVFNKELFRNEDKKKHTAVGFIAKKSEGVLFFDGHKNRGIYFSTDNADQVITILTQYGAQKAATTERTE